MKKILLIFMLPLVFFSTLLQAELPTYENVTRLYVATFNRAPDAAGLEYWVKQSNLQLEQIAQSFFDQPETQALYPKENLDYNTFVKAVYHNLFNRDPDSAGQRYWVQQLQNGSVPKPVFILAVINGAQDTQTYGMDATILRNKKEVGLYFSLYGYNDVDFAKSIMATITEDTQTVAAAQEILHQKSGVNRKDVCIVDYLFYDGFIFSACYLDISDEDCFAAKDQDEEAAWYAFPVKGACTALGFPEETESITNSGFTYYYIEGLFPGVGKPVEVVREPDAVILSLESIYGNTVVRGMLVPKNRSTLRLSRLEKTDIKIKVSTSRGIRTLTPESVSIKDNMITFTVPEDSIEGNITVTGEDFISTVMPYTVMTERTPYLTNIIPDSAKAGDTIELKGVNLGRNSVQIVFEGQSDQFIQTVIPTGNAIRFKLPDGVGSGSVYVKTAKRETNRLPLSVKREIKVEVKPVAGIVYGSSDISFVEGGRRHRLDSEYKTRLDVENKEMQYVHATVPLNNEKAAVLYSAVVLPDMTGTVIVDAKSTAVAWLFMGMSAGHVMDIGDLRVLYERLNNDVKVQMFADYIADLQKEDFSAWAQLSDTTMQQKYQEALKHIITETQNIQNAMARGSVNVDPNAVVIKMDPENNNIYASDYVNPRIGLGEKLNNGTLYLVNDTRLFMSVEARAKKDGNIVNKYRHMQSAIDANTYSLVSPKGWPIFGISSLKQIDLRGKDSHIEVVIGASRGIGETDKKTLADGLKTRVFLEGVGVPILNMVFRNLLNQKIDKHFGKNISLSKRVVTALTFCYGPNVYADLVFRISRGDAWSTIAKAVIIDPVSNGLKSCFDVGVTATQCEQTVKAIAELTMGAGTTENIVNKIMIKMAEVLEKKLLEDSVALLPVAGWITRAAFFVYDHADDVADVGTIGESQWDMKHNPREINIDVDFPLEIASVTPTCVAISPSQGTQKFVIKGDGLALDGDEAPEVYIGSGTDKTESTHVDAPYTDEIDTTAFFNAQELMDEGSWSSHLYVRHLGQMVMYNVPIRMISTEDETVYFDKVVPERAILGQTVVLKGCGWVPLDTLKVFFTSQNGEIEGDIISKTINEIKVKVPQDAKTGLIRVKAGKKEYSRLFDVIPFGIFSVTRDELIEGTAFSLSGKGLEKTAHLYFTDVEGHTLEGSISNVTESGMWVKTPAGLKIGPVKIQAELDNGMRSNTLNLKRVPESPTAAPAYGAIGNNGLRVTLSQDEGADIYYRLNDNTEGMEKHYTGPITLTLDQMKYTKLFLYPFARVTVNGVNYDSAIGNITGYEYDACKEGETLNENRECVGNTNTGTWNNWPHPQWCPTINPDPDCFACWHHTLVKGDYRIHCGYDPDNGNILVEETPYLNSVNDNSRDGYSKQYVNGKLSIVNLYHGGERIGYYSYYDNLILSRRMICTNDWKNCVDEGWYSNGNQKYIQNTIDNIRYGNSKTWYDNGILGSSSNYNSKGEYDGVFEEWYYDGKVKSCSVWSNNKYIGDCD